jgi:hypothetical protein
MPSVDSGRQLFIRHGPTVVAAGSPPEAWALSHGAAESVRPIRPLLRYLTRPLVVSSEYVKARATADLLSDDRAIDPRLNEVSRPWVDDITAAVRRYLDGGLVNGWEPQEQATARFSEAVQAWGSVAYVTHGTVLALYLSSRFSEVRPFEFWGSLSAPDAWLVDGEQLVHVGDPGRDPHRNGLVGREERNVSDVEEGDRFTRRAHEHGGSDGDKTT